MTSIFTAEAQRRGDALREMADGAPVEPPRATVQEDAALLGPWANAFAAVCDAPVAFAPFDVSDPTAGQRMTFPPIFTPIELVGGTGHFRQHPEMVAQVRRLGFEWNADGRVMTVPAPGVFNARIASLGTPQAGFSIAYFGAAASTMPLGPWLLRYMHGVITVLVCAPAFYDSLLRGGLRRRHRDQARWGLMSLAHDLSVHALNYHLIPHAAVTDLANRIRTAVPERYASWAQPGASAPLTLTYFYDNDFNRYAYAVWCRCERPAEFAALFLAKRNYDQLVDALELRLSETRSGRGDVASGDFDDMGKLAETSFDVQ